MIRTAALALVLGATALPAVAEGWSISKLGTMPSVDACMNKARSVINRYIFSHGGGNTGADSWSVYGYDLEPGLQDVVIMCPIGGGGTVNAILVVQSESGSKDRSFAAQELLDFWDQG